MRKENLVGGLCVLLRGGLFRNLCVAIVVLAIFFRPCMAQVKLAPYKVAWASQSSGPSGSMPIGNGDIGANVWVDSSGLLQLYISKTDAYSEIGRLLKIGKISISTSPSILDGATFSQTLDIQTGSIIIKATNAKKQSL
jgi:hypothetical protein